jgi:hypothetical protein
MSRSSVDLIRDQTGLELCEEHITATDEQPVEVWEEVSSMARLAVRASLLDGIGEEDVISYFK